MDLSGYVPARPGWTRLLALGTATLGALELAVALAALTRFGTAIPDAWWDLAVLLNVLLAVLLAPLFWWIGQGAEAADVATQGSKQSRRRVAGRAAGWAADVRSGPRRRLAGARTGHLEATRPHCCRPLDLPRSHTAC